MYNSSNQNTKQDILYMLPKIERHIEYVLGVVLKLPRVEKFNIGQEMKLTVYDTLRCDERKGTSSSYQ